MTITEANRLRVCLWCGEPGAGLYRAVRQDLAKDIRSCNGCFHRWYDNGWRLHERAPLGVEITAETKAA